MEVKTLRQLTEHVVNPANERIVITVAEEPGQGGATHLYEITGFDTETNPSKYEEPSSSRLLVIFHNGPIGVDGTGINGITHEALLAIVADRLRGLQAGPYACKSNAVALTHIEEALLWLPQYQP